MGSSGGRDKHAAHDDAGVPARTRVYRNHHLDSTRWDGVQLREGDVVITTPFKAGATWMQHIVAMLADGDADRADRSDPAPSSVCWVDARFGAACGRGGKEEVWQQQAARRGRRTFKSHLPFDALPYHPGARYVVVCRDPRDVFMSLHHHYRSYTPEMFAMLNDDTNREFGPELGPCPEDPRDLWHDWLTRGAFEWESEGWPFIGCMHHMQSYWEFRHLPNVLLIHHADMKEDLRCAVRRVAGFCGYDTGDAAVRRAAAACTFDEMRARAVAAEADPGDGAGRAVRACFGGAAHFFHSGENGRWRGVLTAADLAVYEEAKRRVLSPDCAAWCEAAGWLPFHPYEYTEPYDGPGFLV